MDGSRKNETNRTELISVGLILAINHMQEKKRTPPAPSVVCGSKYPTFLPLMFENLPALSQIR
jgi:hypothetical protein